MFVTDAVLLKWNEVKDRERVYTLFTKQFGKIQAFRKETPSAGYVDIGTRIECSIDRKGTVNRLRSIRPIRAFGKEWRKYEELVRFLFVMKSLYDLLPEGLVEADLYAETVEFLELCENPDTDFLRLAALFCLRIGHFFGIQEPGGSDPVLEKLVFLAHSNSLKQLLNIRWITAEHVETIHLHSLRIFQSRNKW